MLDDPTITFIVNELQRVHNCHTIILYGSRARGDYRAGSDYDVIGVREAGERIHDARLWNGVYLDMVIYPEPMIASPDEGLLMVRGGVILCQKEGLGERFLAQLEALFAQGPKPLSSDEQNLRRTWARKMLARLQEGDVEGNYRRVWLLMALLEDYFHLRNAWYLGPKHSFAWLKIHDPATWDAFEQALQPGANNSTIEYLVEIVVASSDQATANKDSQPASTAA